MHTRFFSSRVKGRRGVALIITLAFVVLLTVCIIAFFSRAVSERQVSSGSASQTRVEIFAQSAADTIIGDLKQEIAAGSVSVTPSASSSAIYRPKSPITAIPFRVGQAAITGTNLIKQSLNVPGSGGNGALPFYSPPPTSITGTVAYDTTTYPAPARASLLPTDTAVSLNGRSISKARWNEPLLLPVTSGTDYTPASPTFTAPDWILVSRSGTNPIISSSNQTLQSTPTWVWSGTGADTVVGRYAYNIYDEGGLLDVNVAGYPVSLPPSVTATSQAQFSAYKPALAYADLTQVGLTQQQVNALVGWRNYASTQITSGSFPNYSFPIAYGTNYYNYVLYNQNGFLDASGTALNAGSAGGVGTTKGQSDHVFSSRQQLIQFLLDDPAQGSSISAQLNTINALQYLGTFTRDLNQPSFVRLQSTTPPSVTNPVKAFDYNLNVPQVLTNGANGKGGNNGTAQDDKVNPSFLAVTASSSFLRADGVTKALPGEPLVKRRFPLNRLAWITYEGPSADVITKYGVNDANIQALITDGIPLTYLQQGTDANVQKYFGLTYSKDLTDSNFEYYYNVDNNDPTGQASAGGALYGTSASAKGPILDLSTIAGLRANAHDPDFFELLKATINIGCLGKGLVCSGSFMGADASSSLTALPSQQPYNYNYYLESDVDAQVMQIGANIISQFQPANFPIRINFNDGSNQLSMPLATGHTFAGAVNLPYLYELIAGNLQLDLPNPLPRGNPKTYAASGTNPYGAGNIGSAGYDVITTDTLTSTGIGVSMEVPVVWNPTDPSCLATTATNGTVYGKATGNLFGASPQEIRVVADSCTPDQTGDYLPSQPSTSGAINNDFWAFFAYGRSKGTTANSSTGITGIGQYSCNGYQNSPALGDTGEPSSNTDAWYIDKTGNGSGQSIAHYLWTPPGQGTVIGTAGRDEIDMSLAAGRTTWCPEPVMLYKCHPTTPTGVLTSSSNFSDLNGNLYSISVPQTALLWKDAATSDWMKDKTRYGGWGGLRSAAPNAANMEVPTTQSPSEPFESSTSTGIYIGLELGPFPYAWYCPPGYNAQHSGQVEGLSAEQSSGYATRYATIPTANNPPGIDTAGYLTYRMQYLDPQSGNWITYDTKYGKVSNDQIQNGIGPVLASKGTASYQSTLLAGYEGQGGYEGYWACCTDPRTSRFGLFWSSTQIGKSSSGQNASIDSQNNTASPPPGPEMDTAGNWSIESQNAAGWLDPGNAVLYTTRPDPQAGYYFSSQPSDNDDGWPFNNVGTGGGGAQVNSDGSAFGWMAWLYSSNQLTWGSGGFPGLAPGLLSQNNADIFFEPIRFYGSLTGANGGVSTPNYFADPDGIVRRAMGAFVPGGVNSTSSPAYKNGAASALTAVGLPMARVFNWNTADLGFKVNNPDLTINPLQPVTSSGQAVLTATNQAQSRPYFLHRPFRSVAELGYVFSDTPWRNLDFFTAESGYSALLDVFCVNDETNDATGLVAGKVDLNTRQAPVLQAVLAGAYMDPAQPALTLTASSTEAGITAALSGTIAQALVARTSDTNHIIDGTGPLENVSELVGKWVPNSRTNVSTPILGLGALSGPPPPVGTTLKAPFYDGKLSYAGFSGGVWDNTQPLSRGPFKNGYEDFTTTTGTPKPTIPTGTPEDIYSAYADFPQFNNPANQNGSFQTAAYIERFREAPIRALASVGQTRVWNLLIDVIAQTGRYPRSATSPQNFQVEGEQRYWVHVAIDRYTGQVLDKQVEVVKE